VECTIARLNQDFRDQTVETGHQHRIEDLDRIAELGIRTLRYPVLMETVLRHGPGQADWRWHDERFARLQKLGIEPIAGLVHHGSGPAWTRLDDPEFPEKVATYASQVARRFPWITQFTPVNEPLTTARFSGLYGHWFPHGKSMALFLRTLVAQCRAVVLAMQAIRQVTPAAKLVQTEDLGKTFATPELQDQAAHENSRRWLSFDLLCGRVDPSHAWHPIFLSHGLTAAELDFFCAHPCPPDVMGINHYLTSERFLDHRLALYPGFASNPSHQPPYVDVEAVRMELPAGQVGPLARLREAWERYRLPMAVTEAHHGCTRDEQLRWLLEVWHAAEQLRAEGADLRAVTAWSLFGAVDWNSLLVRRDGFYEPGVFDARSDPPRPTVLAQAARSLATSGSFDHPVLDRAGWWKREHRFYKPGRQGLRLRVVGSPRPIVITGATGTLGRALARICELRGLDHRLLSRREMDITHAASIEAALELHRPWAVVNAAGFVRVADAAREAERCMRENADGPRLLAEACAARGAALVTFSSDLVFDGLLGRACVEGDALQPQGVYGRSKADAERRVLQALPEALVVRTSAFFGPWDVHNFAHGMLQAIARGQAVEASDSAVVSPTYVPDLAHAALDLLVDGAGGVWHLANQGAVSWFAFARLLAQAAGLDAESVRKAPEASQATRITALASERGRVMPSLEHGIDRYLHDSQGVWRAAVG
jgi:dTDP-4-dehydrorhamnose reductase